MVTEPLSLEIMDRIHYGFAQCFPQARPECLAVEFNEDANTYKLFFVYPNSGHKVPIQTMWPGEMQRYKIIGELYFDSWARGIEQSKSNLVIAEHQFVAHMTESDEA